MSRTNFRELLSREGRIVYTNRGDSMMPLIRNGKDLLVIERLTAPLKKYDIPLYQRDNGEYVLHRIIGIRKDGYVLCGDHRWQREYGVRPDQMLGRLTSITREGKTIRLDSPRCRLYGHLWCDLFYLRAAILRGKSWLRRRRRKG